MQYFMSNPQITQVPYSCSGTSSQTYGAKVLSVECKKRLSSGDKFELRIYKTVTPEVDTGAFGPPFSKMPLIVITDMHYAEPDVHPANKVQPSRHDTYLFGRDVCHEIERCIEHSFTDVRDSVSSRPQRDRNLDWLIENADIIRELLYGYTGIPEAIAKHEIVKHLRDGTLKRNRFYFS